MASAAAYALLVRDLLASPAGSFDALLDSARRVLTGAARWADDSIPGDAARTAAALSRAVKLLEGGVVLVPQAERYGHGTVGRRRSYWAAFWCAADAVKARLEVADDATVRVAPCLRGCAVRYRWIRFGPVGAMTAALWAAVGFAGERRG